jgi:hypothetical protein
MNGASLKMLFEQTHLVQLPSIPQKTPIEIEGNSASEVIIVVKKSDIDILLHKEMLNKLLQAVKCPLPEGALVMILGENECINIHTLLAHDAIKRIIAFGISPKSMGIFATIRAYVPTKIGEQQWLFSENLATIYHQKEKKGALWAALQVFFELK